MFGRKKQIEKFSEEKQLPAELNIQNLRRHPALTEINSKIKTLQEHLKTVNDSIANFREYPAERGKSIDEHADAILSGGDLNVTALRQITSFSQLIDIKLVLQKALERGIQQRNELEVKLIRQELKRIAPAAQKVVGKTIAIFEQLLEQLKLQQVMFSYFSRNGYASCFRDAHWQTTLYEQRLLFGDNQFPSLEYYISQRKKLWGMGDDDNKNKKSV